MKTAATLLILPFLCASGAPVRGDCGEGELHCNHDGTFESGYNWWSHPEGYGGLYYGAFAEAYDLGSGTLQCGAYWVTQAGYLPAGYVDAYVWDGGVSREPGRVLAFAFDAQFRNIPAWPQTGQNDVEIPVEVTGEFTIGYWLEDCWDDVWVAADLDGLGGRPWTCIAPGTEWPSGWQDPSIVFGPTQSLGIGVWFSAATTPSTTPTWGSVKSLFR